MCACMLGCSVVSNSVTTWTVAHEASMSMEYFRQRYWSGLPFSSSRRIFLTQGWNWLLSLLHWQVDSLPLVPCGTPHILDINPLLDTSLANMLSHSRGRLFILLIVSFAMKKTFSFDGEFRQTKTKRIYHSKLALQETLKGLI